jgi:hypothetical protein
MIEPSRLSTMTGEYSYSICGGTPYLPSTNVFQTAVVQAIGIGAAFLNAQR